MLENTVIMYFLSASTCDETRFHTDRLESKIEKVATRLEEHDKDNERAAFLVPAERMGIQIKIRQSQLARFIILSLAFSALEYPTHVVTAGPRYPSSSVRKVSRQEYRRLPAR
jgi:hypothetical protein